MSKKDVIEEKAWALLQRVANELDLIPVDAEYVKTAGEYNLLIYVDKEGGIGIDECEACSRAIDPLLDEEDFIPKDLVGVSNQIIALEETLKQMKAVEAQNKKLKEQLEKAGAKVEIK